MLWLCSVKKAFSVKLTIEIAELSLIYQDLCFSVELKGCFKEYSDVSKSRFNGFHLYSSLFLYNRSKKSCL